MLPENKMLLDIYLDLDSIFQNQVCAWKPEWKYYSICMLNILLFYARKMKFEIGIGNMDMSQNKGNTYGMSEED